MIILFTIMVFLVIITFWAIKYRDDYFKIKSIELQCIVDLLDNESWQDALIRIDDYHQKYRCNDLDNLKKICKKYINK